MGESSVNFVLLHWLQTNSTLKVWNLVHCHCTKLHVKVTSSALIVCYQDRAPHVTLNPRHYHPEKCKQIEFCVAKYLVETKLCADSIPWSSPRWGCQTKPVYAVLHTINSLLVTVYKIYVKFTYRVSCDVQTHFQRKKYLWYWICSFLLSIHYQLSASARTQTRDNVIDKLAEEIRSIKVHTPYDIFL